MNSSLPSSPNLFFDPITSLSPQQNLQKQTIKRLKITKPTLETQQSTPSFLQIFHKSIYLYLVAVFASVTLVSTVGSESEVPPVQSLTKSQSPQQQSSLSTTHKQQYSPEEFFNICMQFPALTACQAPHEMEKRKSAYMRFGRSSNNLPSKENAFDNFEKRKSAYMRFGKRFSPYEEFDFEENTFVPEMAKRKSAYMRFGKRKSAYMRFGKRSFNEFENNNEQGLTSPFEMEKRKSAYMRFGKRSLLASENNIEKRKSAYMRFGRR